MAANKRPRKKHKPLSLGIPLLLDVAIENKYVSDEDPYLALRTYSALTTLIERPTVDAANEVTRIVARIAIALDLTFRGIGLDRIPARIMTGVQSGLRALQDISDRITRTGAVVVNTTEALTLNAAAAVLDESLLLIPVHMWERAELTVKRNEAFCRLRIAQQLAA